jgi:site-specific DNA-methyltransferase (adenine-specific)
MAEVIHANCLDYLKTHKFTPPLDLTFLDLPFNQDKEYQFHNDKLPEAEYWNWIQTVCTHIYNATSDGGAIYFMQREKNTEEVLRCLREAGWTFQNLIIWKKKTSAVPSNIKYGKQYQIIVFATKGKKPRIFHKLRINPPLPAEYKHERPTGMFVTDVWDDIRELTSGYFAGDEALRTPEGERFHKQQAPLALLLRIILSSTQVGDTVFDPFAGTGTTLVVAEQLQRQSIGIDIDPNNVQCIENRLATLRKADQIATYYDDYIHTENLKTIWGSYIAHEPKADLLDLPLFRIPPSE